MFLVSSNPKKLNEIRRFGLDLELRPGVDLKEVAGTPDEVVFYKAQAAGPGAVVEDTILVVDGEPVVDIRWRLDDIRKTPGISAQWIVSLGYNDGKFVHLFRGKVNGHLISPSVCSANAFGFDPYFVPDGAIHSLAELEHFGQKDRCSARRLAVEQLMAATPMCSRPLADLPVWEGAYQAA